MSAENRLKEIEYRLEHGEINIAENVKNIKKVIRNIRAVERTIRRVDRLVTALFFATAGLPAVRAATVAAATIAAKRSWDVTKAITVLGGGEYAIAAPAVATAAAPVAAGLTASSIVPFLPLILAFIIPAVTAIAENLDQWERERLERERIKEIQIFRTEILREVRENLETEARRRESFRSTVP